MNNIGSFLMLAAFIGLGVYLYNEHRKGFFIYLIVLGSIYTVAGAGLFIYGIYLTQKAKVVTALGSFVVDDYYYHEGISAMLMGGAFFAVALPVLIISIKKKKKYDGDVVKHTHTPHLYYLTENGKNSGPYSEDELRDMVKQRKITEKTYVWYKGMTDWSEAANVPELADILQDGPVNPPAPKQM